MITIETFYKQAPRGGEYRLYCDLVRNGVLYQECDIEMVNCAGQPDCKVSHFWYNFWFRTNAWVNTKMYNLLDNMIAAIKKEVTKKEWELVRVWCVHKQKTRETTHVLYTKE